MTNNTTIIDMRQFVETKSGRVFTTSQQVAEAFDKQHKHVLEKVRGLECSSCFLTANFSTVQFDHRGNAYESYEITKDGFMFLVMGFTGKKAAAIKEGYINAFNAMAEQLGKNAQTIVEDIIGTAGVNVLNNVIRQKGIRLSAEKQRSFACTIKSRLRGRFNVARVELIPAKDMAAACDFIAAYALEGEYLERLAGGGAITLNEYEAGHLYSLMSSFFYLHELNAKHRFEKLGRGMNSKPLHDLGEIIGESGLAFSQLDKRRDELYKIRTQSGLQGGYAQQLKGRLFNDYSQGFAV